jgi:hypothetical protein
MTLTITDVFTPATQPEWFASFLTNADRLGLASTSWQSGSDARVILTALSFAMNFEDATVSAIAQGSFLDFAASGTVTYTTPQEDGSIATVTAPVSPDPSVPGQNDDGTPTWLDILCDGRYNVQRIQTMFAGGPQAICNTAVSSYGPFTAGTYHVADPNNGATYANTASLTILPSPTVGTVAGVVALSGLIEVATSSAHGLSTGAVVTVAGVGGVTQLVNPTSWYVDVVDSTHFTLRGSSFSGSYTTGGTVYTPTVATVTADVSGSGSNSVDSAGVPNARTVTQTVTALVGVTTSNLAAFTGTDIEGNVALAKRARLKLQSLSPNGPGGAYEFAALSAQTLALTLPTLETLSQAITRVTALTDPLTGRVLVFVANASGAVTSEDLAVANDVIQAYATPLAVTSAAANPTDHPMAVTADVWVPAALNNATTEALFEIAIQSYFATLKIGGLTDPGGAYVNVVPFDAVLGVIFKAAQMAGIAVEQATLTLAGGTSNVTLLYYEVATLSPVVPTITLHSKGP